MPIYRPTASWLLRSAFREPLAGSWATAHLTVQLAARRSAKRSRRRERPELATVLETPGSRKAREAKFRIGPVRIDDDAAFRADALFCRQKPRLLAAATGRLGGSGAPSGNDQHRQR